MTQIKPLERRGMACLPLELCAQPRKSAVYLTALVGL